METRQPRYLSAFRCLAGECPHTCCAGWEVPVDPASAELYHSLPGPLGDRVRGLMEPTPEGEARFPLRGGRCPFLSGEGLCHIHLELGEEATPLTCRTHPRFRYRYGPLEERGLCGSCPEAARLILTGDPTLTTGWEEGPGEDPPPLLSPLLLTRETALDLLSAGEATPAQRFQALLLFANEVQVLLDRDQPENIPSLCAFYREGFPLLSGLELPPRRQALDKCLDLLAGLETLQPQWRELLTAGREAAAPPPPPPQMALGAGTYFLYRHWLRGVWDGDVLTWAEFAVLGVAVSALLSPLQPGGFPGAFRLLCQELEHSQGNMAALQDALWDRVSLAEMLSAAAL